MGTRARINIIDRGEVFCSIYRHWDGYPSGLGKDIADFSKGMIVVNGIPVDDDKIVMGKAANRMGCYAAQLIKHLKDDIGNVKLRSTKPDSYGEEYIYNINEKDGLIWIDVLSGHMTAFGNPGDEETEMETIWSGFARDFDADKLEDND